jgi:SAM-dependent methyltransferase
MTPEEVTLAYRLMLGREPESPEVVNNLCHTVHTVAALRESFLGAPEFRLRMGQLLDKPQHVRERHPYTLPAIPVEVEVPDEALQRMFERIHQEWEYLGETDPYWSVVTQPQFHLDQFEQHRQSFYRSGQYACELFLAALRRNGVNPNLLHTGLEVGCGVGRVTAYLARALPELIAADISGHHVEIARQHLAEQGLTNVRLLQWRALQELQALPALDAVFSVITLQHNPPPVMAWMLQALLGRLKPGGVAYLQIPTYRSGYLFEAERYLHTPPPKSLEMHFLPQPEVFRIVQASACRCLEVREDGMVGDESRMLSNTFLIQKLG